MSTTDSTKPKPRHVWVRYGVINKEWRQAVELIGEEKHVEVEGGGKVLQKKVMWEGGKCEYFNEEDISDNLPKRNRSKVAYYSPASDANKKKKGDVETEDGADKRKRSDVEKVEEEEKEEKEKDGKLKDDEEEDEEVEVELDEEVMAIIAKVDSYQKKGGIRSKFVCLIICM